MAVQVKVYSPKLRKITHRECLRAISSFSQKIKYEFLGNDPYPSTSCAPTHMPTLVKKKTSAIYYQA